MRKKRKKTHPLPKKLNNKKIYTMLIALFVSLFTWFSQDQQREVCFPTAAQPAAFYSNQTQDNLQETFVQAIHQAQKSVILIIYALNDPNIIESLKTKADQGIPVKVICDAEASKFLEKKLGPAVDTVSRFSKGLMHQKILLIDDSKAWIGSANMTPDSLHKHGNLVIGLECPQLVSYIKKKAACLDETGTVSHFEHEVFPLAGQNFEFWFLPDDKGASDKIKSLLRSAQKTIKVAMFTWTRQDFAEEIIKAALRGVRTEVVIDRYSGSGVSKKIVQQLRKNKVPAGLNTTQGLLHHKFLYIDSKILVNGSANWTKAAFTQNDDCFMVLYDLTEDQIAMMDHLWEVIWQESDRGKI